MKNIYIYILTLFLITSCGDRFEELNTDPNKPVTADVKLVLTAAEDNILVQFNRREESYDFISGTFTRTFAGRQFFYDQWDAISSRDSDWDPMYDGLLDAKDVIKRGTEQGLTDHVGVAKILTVVGLGYLTDIYGAVPYSNALQGPTVIAPTFDSQQEIYNTIYKLLEEAIMDLEAGAEVSLGSEDFVFKGNTNRWKAAAAMLLARYHNHLSIKEPAASATKVLEYVDLAFSFGLQGNSGDLTYPYEISGKENPWAGFYSGNPWIVASESFMNLMKDSNDPRIECYWNPTIADGTYRGKDNSSPITGNVVELYSRLGGFYGEESSPMHIATYSEFRFVEAEAALRSGDRARAALAHNAGVKASINKVSPWYSDQLGELDLADYEMRIQNYFDANASETEATINLEKIMTEKFIAIFTMNVESWVDVRRHNYQYPYFHEIPTDDNGNPVASDFTWRGLYPQNEISKNPNTPSATLFEKLWWNQ